MTQNTKPKKLTLCAYQVGFGDCFLLTFHYDTMERHVLIDFGSMAIPKVANSNQMELIAKDIRRRCGGEENGKLHAVVATHRHKDHISGFATNAKKTAPGDIIASLNPSVVIQPWTEHPRADPKTGKLTPLESASKSFLASLQSMHMVSAAVLAETENRRLSFGKARSEQLKFLGEDNLKNLPAVRNLMRMGGSHKYVHFGSRFGLERVLPGVKTHVLGPPNLKQSQEIRKQRRNDPDEYWHLHAGARFWFSQAMAGKQVMKHSLDGHGLFPNAPVYSDPTHPPFARWFIKRMRKIRSDQLLGIVRALDSAMNNTSLILLFEVGRKKLLFPGDAQIENWSYALGKPEVRRLLKGVNLYKVGHHGSLNATPKSMWKLFEHRSEKKTEPDRLQTVVSTMGGQHGETEKTAVPRKTLVEELDKNSNYFTTQDLRGKKKICEEFEFIF
jgi:hypothetical protein